MFIVITGLDGSGTSTVAEVIKKFDTKAIILHTPNKIYSDRDQIDNQVKKVSELAHFYYYLSSVIYESNYIKENYDYINNNVYCVRYLIDTVVSHRVSGLQVELDYEKYNIIKPDKTIFVATKEDIRQERITKRGKSLLDKVLDSKSKRDEFLQEYNNLLIDKYIIDNSGTSSDLELQVKKFLLESVGNDSDRRTVFA